MTAMSAQDNWGFPGLQGKGVGRTAHKIPLVSPKMDVDVSLKNLGTQLIDHPRDDDQRHREKLWSFQQKYRGAAILKLKKSNSCNEADDKKSTDSATDEQTDADQSDSRYQTVSRNVSDTSISLPSRFKKRLNQRNLSVCGFRPGENNNVASRTKSESKEPKDGEKQKQEELKIERLYSSGLLVKTNLYNQLRNAENQSPDSSRLAESLQKYGPGLERLPDIQYPGSKSLNYSKQLKVFKSVSAYQNSKNMGRFITQKTFTLRRSFANSDLGPSKIKLRLVERRKDYETNADSGDSNEADDIDDLQADEDDECDNDNGDDKHNRGGVQKHPEHVDIRHNVTEINTQDDIKVPYFHEDDRENAHLDLRNEQTFFVQPMSTTKAERKKYRRTDFDKNIQAENFNKYFERNSAKHKVKESWTPSKETDSNTNADQNNKSAVKERLKKNSADNKHDCDSDDSLDIPDDRYGPTTHSVDRKLAIRKPWEWRPSPFRWLDRSFVRESDKPLIERVINSGDIIDQYNYDSFARTKPLKLQAFPEGAGYKDRSGVLR